MSEQATEDPTSMTDLAGGSAPIVSALQQGGSRPQLSRSPFFASVPTMLAPSGTSYNSSKNSGMSSAESFVLLIYAGLHVHDLFCTNLGR